MRSGFIDLVVKNRLAGKPLPNFSAPQRYSPVDSFKKYINETLPKLQQSVEIQILKRNLVNIASPKIRKELINAYLRRLFRLRVTERIEIKNYKNIDEIIPQQIFTIVDPTILKPINDHTEYDVGSYILFNNQDYNKVYKHGSYGPYHKKQYAFTKRYGIMIRRESVTIAKVMKLLAEAKPVDWASIYKLKAEERLGVINNEETYPVMFQELANHLYKKVKPLITQEHFQRVWGNSVISDALINSVLQNIDKTDNVFQLLDQAINAVEAIEIKPSNLDFLKRFKTLPTNPVIKLYGQVPYFCRFYYSTPSFKSVFLGGLTGNGKSMILSYLTMYAFKNNWLIISVPEVTDWTLDKNAKPQKMYNNLYVIAEHAVKWLDSFKSTNEHLIKDLKLPKPQAYGVVDITGTSVGEEYDPVPNLYDERRKTYSKDVEQLYIKRTLSESDLRYKYRLTDKLPKPKTILDIVNAGIANPEYSTCAMGELLKQIYEIEHIPILEVVDSFSFLYKASRYYSYRYFNDKGLFGRIPPYHIAHCRLFTNLDGHKIKRGLKVVASSTGVLYKHKFEIKQIMFPDNYEHRVQNLTPQEFEKAAKYNILTKNWMADDLQRQNLQYMFTLCQGNWKEFTEAHQLGHYYR